MDDFKRSVQSACGTGAALDEHRHYGRQRPAKDKRQRVRRGRRILAESDRVDAGEWNPADSDS